MAAAVLCKRWKPGVVWLLLAGAERFSELASGLPGISAKVLTQQLRELERYQLIRRRSAGPSRPSVYELTDLGRRLAELLQHLERWGIHYNAVVPNGAALHGLAGLIERARDFNFVPARTQNVAD